MTRILFFICALCCAQGLMAQTPVVITQENAVFNAPGDMSSWRFVESSSLQIPARGEDQVWDYSQTPNAAGEYTVEYIAPSNPNFPTATVAQNSYYTLNQFQLTGKAYYQARATGEYYIGNSYNAATFDIGIGTLVVPEQTNQIEGFTELRLPATLGTTWKSEQKTPLNSFLTAAAVGLDNAPLTYLQTLSFNDSIIGSGTLKLPGGASYNVLLKKEIWIQTDSFFLYGQPAPEALLSVLGVQQGATSENNSYAFYTPGVSTGVMSFSVYDDGITASYRTDLSTTGVGNARSTHTATHLYPNPVTGESISLEFEKSSGAAWHLTLSNTLGQTVREISVNRPAGQVRVQLDPGAATPNGIYYFELRNEQGNRVAGGPIVIGRE